MRTDIFPTVTVNPSHTGREEELHQHPAYGTITLSNPQGRIGTLFGSDIGHHGCVCIEIHEAELHRHLSRDWIHSRGQLISIEMSHAQFAEFITSQGKGDGTPVTLRWTRGKGDIPGIKKVETKHDTFRKEIAQASRERLDAIERRIKQLGELIESDKMSKKELREIHGELLRHVQQLPGSMEFVVGSAEEALEKATSDAKIEVESYIAATARRLGIARISELAKLENKGETKE